VETPTTISNLVRRYYRAYETKDGNALEELLSDDFTFTSPLDDHLDRASYLGAVLAK
jgi:ketosteroid isomerase-like protein